MICEVSGFSWYLFYVFLRGIVGKMSGFSWYIFSVFLRGIVGEMSGFSWYVFYVFLRIIVGKEKGTGTNGFRCYPKTIEVLTRKLGEGDPVENTCDQQISGLPQSWGRH